MPVSEPCNNAEGRSAPENGKEEESLRGPDSPFQGFRRTTLGGGDETHARLGIPWALGPQLRGEGGNRQWRWSR